MKSAYHEHNPQNSKYGLQVNQDRKEKKEDMNELTIGLIRLCIFQKFFSYFQEYNPDVMDSGLILQTEVMSR